MNTEFTLHLKDSVIGAQFSTSAPSELNNTTRNETATFSLEITSEADDLTINDGETYTIQSGGLEFHDTITVNSGGTLVIEGTVYAEILDDNGGLIDVNSGTLILKDTVSGANRLFEYDPFAGHFDASISEKLEVFYWEFLPDNPPIDSLVIGIEPNQDLQNANIPGVWGLIENITDERNTALSTNRITLEVRVLATFSQFNNHTEVETALNAK